MVSPFLIFFPTSTNFLAPGSGAWYAVPMIGDVISVPEFILDSLLAISFFIAGETEAVTGWLLLDTLFFETLILVSFSVISISVRLNSS